MNKVLWMVGLALALMLGTGARAQDRSWVQIESRPTLAEAELRVRAYAGILEDVAGYALSSGFYAIVIGPYTPDDAALRLALLRQNGTIPTDSFLVDGSRFRDAFWPIGAATPLAPAAPEAALVPAAPIAPVETLADARRDDAALGREDRLELQTALQWFGFYTSGIDGAFGPGTRGAIAAWQVAQNVEGTGFLTPSQRATLIAAWRGQVAELGLTRTTEAEAGIEIDLPLGLVAFAGYEPPFVRYAPANDSGVQLFLISQPGNEGTLSGLYDLLQSAEIMPLTGPRERRARSFEMRGRNAEFETFAYAEVVGGAVKGYLISWPVGDSARIDRVLGAMKASFKSASAKSLDPGLVPLAAAVKDGMLAGLDPRRPERVRSGVYIDARGAVLTAASAVAGCGSVTLDGGKAADVAYADDALGVAVLRPRGALAPSAFARVAQGDPQPRATVAVAGFSFGDALAQPVMTFGTFEAAGGLSGETGVSRLTLSPLEGDIGGAVLDQTGALIGILLAPPTSAGRVLPASVAFAAAASAFAAPLATAGFPLTAATSTSGLAPEDVTAIGRGVAAQVSCWK